MTAASTLILSRAQIRRLASARDYRRAVEAAFLALARGEITTLPVGHVPGVEGGFHLKAAVATHPPRWAVIKINGNFPGNPQQFGLPTIQGCLVLSDAVDGRLLAVMDSIEITAQRTAAASALAAQHLARRDSRRLRRTSCSPRSRDLRSFAGPCRTRSMPSLGTCTSSSAPTERESRWRSWVCRCE